MGIFRGFLKWKDRGRSTIRSGVDVGRDEEIMLFDDQSGLRDQTPEDGSSSGKSLMRLRRKVGSFLRHNVGSDPEEESRGYRLRSWLRRRLTLRSRAAEAPLPNFFSTEPADPHWRADANNNRIVCSDAEPRNRLQSSYYISFCSCTSLQQAQAEADNPFGDKACVCSPPGGSDRERRQRSSWLSGEQQPPSLLSSRNSWFRANRSSRLFCLAPVIDSKLAPTVGVDMDPLVEHDESDNEDDPTKLLNQWLGELNSLKKGIDYEVGSNGAPVNRRPPNAGPVNNLLTAEKKKLYRCSLINLDDTNQADDELDAILGELTVLESQFDQEIVLNDSAASPPSSNSGGSGKQLVSNGHASPKEAAQAVLRAKNGPKNGVILATQTGGPVSPAESDRSSSNMTVDLGIHSNTHSRSSSGSDEQLKAGNGCGVTTTANSAGLANSNNGSQIIRKEGGRMESPDTDSAFCDNLSVLSSCSAASSNQTGGNSTGQAAVLPTSVAPLSKEEQEAKIKAEKIRIAIEKIKEASVKKLFIKVFTSDGSAKSLLVDEKMSVGQVTRILAEKNHVSLDPKWALVELVPDLYMERVYEDHEQLVENCLLWKMDSKNTLWFIERPEKFDLFIRPEVYLLGTSSSQKDDQMEEHARQELLEEYFSSSGVGAPEVEGNIWLKADSKKSWKKFYFVLRSSGLYYAPKGKKTSKDLICLTTFDVNQVYYGVGWKNKYKAPTDFCFGIKHPQIQSKNPKYIKYLCVDTHKELHQWVTGIRIAKNGKHLFDNYRQIVEEIAHNDIDILTSKRYSVNSNTGIPSVIVGTPGGQGKNQGQDGLLNSPARTPSSENKSLASALSSGVESDLSQASSGQHLPLNSLSTCQNGSSTASSSLRPALVGAVDPAARCSSSTSSSEPMSEKDDRVSGLTPVGTLERSFKLRRSFSRSSRASSSSSGCLSDKSGAVGAGSVPTVGEHGFESDFPLGGTIKKRPSAVANPRLPLTNTTWGLVKESDQEEEEDMLDSGRGAIVGIGAGGTLLRQVVRNNLSSRKLPEDVSHNQFAQSAPSVANYPARNAAATGDSGPDVVDGPPSIESEDPMSTAFEDNIANGMTESMYEESLPLPPPPPVPRMDSISSLDDIDQLPPPPPLDGFDLVPSPPPPPPPPQELLAGTESKYSSHYHVSPVSSPSVNSKPVLPPSCVKPPALNKKAVPPLPPSTLQKPPRRISFDDNVQMIDPVSPTKNGPGFDSSRPGQPPVAARYTLRQSIMAKPGKLMFGQDTESNTNSLPRSFLADLQKVMKKKWQVAEKCRTADKETTPHEVLGFRDEPLRQNDNDGGGLYSHSSAIGAWVMETQQYTAVAEPEEELMPPLESSPRHPQQHNQYRQHNGNIAFNGTKQHQQIAYHSQPQMDHPQQHCSPQQHLHNYQQHPQQHPGSPYSGGRDPNYPPHAQMTNGHAGIYEAVNGQAYHHLHAHRQRAASASPRQCNGSPSYSPHHPPINQPYSAAFNGAYNGGPVVLREPEPNYVDPSSMRANKHLAAAAANKRPPPPPRRSENTQLSASNY